VLYFFVFLGLFSFSYVNAQEFDTLYLKTLTENENADFYHLKTNAGTEQNSITTIAQDSIGQMWFATKDGLLRNNGREFFVYKYNPENPRSIGDNFVNSVFVSKDGNLWVGSVGLVKYRQETDDFEPIAPKELSKTEVYAISQDSNGLLWFIDRDTTLYSYDDITKELLSFEFEAIENHYVKTAFSRVLATKTNRIFITTNQPYFLEFKPETNSFHQVYFMTKSEIESLPNYKRYVFSITEDHTGNIWLASLYKYAIKYDINNESFTRYYFDIAYSEKKIYVGMFIFEDADFNIWIGTWINGLLKISPNRLEVSQILPDPKKAASLSNNIITAGFQDKAGYLWFGSEFAGINILKKNKKFSVLANNPKEENSLPPVPYTSAIKDTTGRVWVGTDGAGLHYFNPNDIRAYKTSHPILKKPTRIFTILLGEADILWIGTGIGLYKYNINRQVVKYYPRNKEDFNSLGGRNVISLCQDHQGNIWAGTIHGGLTKLDVAKEKFTRFMPDADNPNSLSYKYVSAIYSDSNQDLWVGTLKGLNKFNPASGNFTIFKPSNANSINSERINCLYEKNGSLWIGTDGGGLNEYDLKTKEFKNYLDKDNPITYNIKGITSDDNNNLWLSTTHNILKFDLDSKQFIVYTASDGLENEMYIKDYGLQKLQFSENFATRDFEGYLYFGGISGMTIFHPDSLPQNNYKPPVIIDELKVNGTKHNINGKREIILESHENHIEISLTALNFIQPDKNSYAHYLENYDKEWIYDGLKNTVEYFNIPKGTYQFHFKGANNDGVWNDTVQPISITVLPMFYQTTGFYLLLVAFVFLILAAFVFYKWYVKRQIAHQKKMLRYTSSTLSEEETNEINEKLIKRLAKDDIYLEADLSLHKLAEEIAVKPHSLSQVINQYHQKHFHDFINTYRIEEAKRLLIETSLKIEAVAYDSGFNSISTFNVAFKKETGVTPSKYRKNKS